jgi:hypothetical protein
MKIQKLAIATVVGTVFIFLLDMVWYTMIMKDNMDMPNARLNAAGEPYPDMMWMIIGYAVFALAFVSIYAAWSGGSSKVSSGLNFGIWAGLLVGLSMNLMWYSLTTLMTLSESMTDSVYTIVKCILLGIIVAYVTGHPGGDRGKATGGGE